MIYLFRLAGTTKEGKNIWEQCGEAETFDAAWDFVDSNPRGTVAFATKELIDEQIKLNEDQTKGNTTT